MFHSLTFNGWKFQLDSICLGFAPHDITVIMWFWFVVVRENRPIGAGAGVRTFVLKVPEEETAKLNTLIGGSYLIFPYLKPNFSARP